MNKSLIGFGITLVIILALGWLGKNLFEAKFGLGQLPEAKYVSAVHGRDVVQAAEGLPGLTRLKITPDEWTMFATTIDGKVWVLNNVNNEGRYVLQPEPIYSVATGFELGEENGMTGLAVSYDFILDHYVFVSYTKREGQEGRNRIDRLTLEQADGKWRVKEVKNIFVGNVPVLGAHQIQGMIVLPVEDKVHLMFTVGDAFVPEHAKDLSKEAGKVMMIQTDGSNPLGERPYPNYPKIQATGVRNAYDLARNELNNWIYLSNNGPEANDVIAYAPLLDADNKIDFGWDGKAESMLTPTMNGEAAPQLIIKSWDVTVSPTDIAVDSLGRFFVNIYSTTRNPNKEVWMGEMNSKNKWKMTKVANRRFSEEGGGTLGLAISNLTGNIWFGDTQDGALYVLGRTWELIRLLPKS